MVLMSAVVRFGASGCASLKGEERLARHGAEFADPGEWPSEPVTFLEKSHLDDDMLNRLQPSLHSVSPTSVVLEGVPETDASIPVMQSLPSMRYLALWDTKLTPDGVARPARVIARVTGLQVGGNPFDEIVVAILR